MATVTTGPYHIQCALHGNGVANSSNYPIINADFEITFSRDTGSQTVTWQISNNTWSGTSSGNGHYAFQFWAEPTINDQTPPEYGPYIISKTDTTWKTNWWNDVTLYNPSGSFTSTSDVATLKLWVWSECTNSGGSCYGHGWRQVYAIDLVIPVYETFYPVTYDSNGGTPTPTPNPQQQSNITNLQITSTVPGRSGNVSYYYGNTLVNTQNVNIPFTGWKCSADNQIYNYPNYYTLLQACTMTAQWGSGTYTVLDEPDKIARITYYYNGGSGVPYTDLVVSKQGWNTSSAGTGTSYAIGSVHNDFTSAFNLYAMYGNASISENSLPKPTRSGYAFDGWYKEPTFVNKVTGTLTITGDINLYAKWISLPVYKFSNGAWQGTGPYVWKFTGSQWEKIAPVYKFNGTNWENLST